MATDESCDTGFCGIGKWAGTAEVFSGEGTFLGNGSDQRFARTEDSDGRVRIDLAFIGPLKFAGHYYIKPDSAGRAYQGPANTGFAESVGELAVDGNGFWPVTGLSHKLFLAMLPDQQTQLHLSQMFRGEQLIYTIVSESQRVLDDGKAIVPGLVSGTSYDFANDPKAGRDSLLLHRPGKWAGEVSSFDGDLKPKETASYEELVELDNRDLRVAIRGSLGGDDATIKLHTNDYQAWSEMGPVVGSYNLIGGRGLTGTFHHLDSNLRVVRREVATNDGSTKAILHNWYRGGQRVGAQFGVLKFSPENSGE